MNALPTTSLHEKSFANDWKKWIDKQIEMNDYVDLEQAMKDCLRITRGRINPKLIKESCYKINRR